MAHTKVSIVRNWYGKLPLDRNGNPIPKNLWPKRRKHSWEVRWYSSEGKRYSKSFKSREEANEYAKHLQGKVDKGKSDKPRQITLAEFMKEHEQVMVGQVAYATLKDQLRALRFFADHIGHQSQLGRITPRHAESFVAVRLSQNRTVSTVNKDIRTLKGIFNRAIEPRGYLPEGGNPFEKIRQRKVADRPPRYVSHQEFSRVYLATDNLWWKSFLVLAYTSAGRRDELLNLTWVDIDFAGQTVQFVPKAACDNILAWEPKDHEARVVPVPPETVQLLADWQSQADEETPYLFVPAGRLKHILQRRAQRKWRSDDELINNLTRDLGVICARARVDCFTPHDLRRSCITNWARSLPIQVIQQLAGHSNMETTRKYYLSVQQGDLNLARQVQSKLMTSLTNY